MQALNLVQSDKKHSEPRYMRKLGNSFEKARGVRFMLA